jgi:ABC-type bacteriocin/lantibiotic exporter with double-glycine peptidase domain
MRLLEPVTLAREQVSASDLQEIWTGRVVLVTRRAFGAGADPRTYGFRWFVPSLWRYRGPFAHVLLASLFIQLFALATPLFFQLVVDKVLVHKGLETLVVLVLGLSIIGIFDAVLQYLRTYALSHTASRIDAELSRTTFEPVDMVKLVLALVSARDSRGVNAGARIEVTHRGAGTCYVPGDPARLERVLENLLDNAVSF